MSTVIGKKWGGGRDGMPGGTVTWSFATSSSQTDRLTFQKAITGDLQLAVRDAFARWASVAQIDFVEVPFSNNSDITIGFYEMDGNGPQWGLVTYSTLAANTGRGDNHASFIHAAIYLDGAE